MLKNICVQYGTILESAYKYQILIFNWICEKFFLIRVWIQTLNGKLCNLILLSKVNISKTLFCLSSGLKHQILHYTRYQEASHTRAGVGVNMLLIMCMKKTHWCKSTCRTQFIAQQCRLGRGRAVIPGSEAGNCGGGAGNSGAPLAGPSHPQSRSVISPATTLAIKYFLMLKYFLCCIRWVLPGNQSSQSGASNNVVASVQRRIDRTDSR